MEPVISVIIPVYNVEPFLYDCLHSLENQTLSQIEIICVDDESADNSVQIVKDFAERDPRFHLLRQSHQGVSAARNLGISHAQGQYIMFADGDDWLEADMLKKCWTEQKQPDAMLSFALRRFFLVHKTFN